MAPEEKPYRVYRGGRRGPNLPKLGLPSRKPAASTRGKRGGRVHLARACAPRSSGQALLFCVFLLWLAAWGLAGYFSFRDGVKAANKRVPAAARRQLSGRDNFLMTSPTTILLLGTDTRPGRGQRGLRHSDSIMLVRTDPDHHRLFYLSIPRDLWVDIPGYGSDRINTAYQIGGSALALKTIKEFTGLDIDHVVIVDFQRFKQLIDSDRRRRRLRAACDPLEPLRLPAQAGEVRDLDRLALREGHAAHGWPPCARLLARP